MNTEGALPILERLVDRYGDSSEVMIGAGTVLTADQVSDAATVGVEFIVSPNVHADVIQRTRDLELVSMPGFFSPTEAFDALRFGGQYLKCFPAQTLGLGYIRDLKAVLPAPILAVGGVRCDTARATLEWCAGIGVGGSVWGPGMTPEQGLERVRALLAACRGD